MNDSGNIGGMNSPINIQKLNDMFKNNTDFVKKILSSFDLGFSDFEKQFGNAQNSGDEAARSGLAHSLRGSYGNIRADLFCSQATEQARNNELDVHGDSFDDLLKSLDDLNKQINTLM